MSLSSARAKFREVAEITMDHDLKRLAEDLVLLKQEISSGVTKLENELATIKKRMNSLR